MDADPIQVRMNRLAEVPGVALALLVFHPSPGAMEYRFASQVVEKRWSLLEELAARYRTEGESEECAKALSIEHAPYQLLATTVNPFLKDGTPFIVALVAGEDGGPAVLDALRSTIQDCMGLAYRR